MTRTQFTLLLVTRIMVSVYASRSELLPAKPQASTTAILTPLEGCWALGVLTFGQMVFFLTAVSMTAPTYSFLPFYG